MRTRTTTVVLLLAALTACTSNTQPKTEPSATALVISDECRAWIISEFTDTSDTVDAEAGFIMCDGMSPDQMDQAIDQVTRELQDAGGTATENSAETEG